MLHVALQRLPGSMFVLSASAMDEELHLIWDWWLSDILKPVQPPVWTAHLETFSTASLHSIDILLAWLGEPSDPASPPPAAPSSDEKPGDKKTKWLATLREFTKKLKGTQQRVLALLIEANGSMSIADIATDKQVSWQKPYKGSVDGLTRVLNEKLRPLKTSLKVSSGCLELAPKAARKPPRKMCGTLAAKMTLS